MSPRGTPATGPATVGTESPQPGTSYSSSVLAAEMLPNVVPGGAAVSVYTFSADWHFSRCCDACARDFIPLTTVGKAAVLPGANPSEVGVVRRGDGSR